MSLLVVGGHSPPNEMNEDSIVPASLLGEVRSAPKNTGIEAGAIKAGTVVADTTPYLRNAVLSPCTP